MPILGAHESIAGGTHKAVLTAKRLGCDVVQLFTKNNMQWAARPLGRDDVDAFRTALAETGVGPAVAHASYLVNMASPDPALCRRSTEALVDEVRRAEALGLPYLVIHPGSHMGEGVEAGIKRVVTCLNTVHNRCRKAAVKVVLETTAGAGNCLGGQFEHLAEVLWRVRSPERLGVCLDTCHVFAAGYDLRTFAAARRTLAEFDRVIGVEVLHVVHLNDSVGELGGRLDRHAHIGQGKIGLDGFQFVVRDSGLLEERPGLLETPKGKRGRQDYDRINLRALRRLAGG